RSRRRSLCAHARRPLAWLLLPCAGSANGDSMTRTKRRRAKGAACAPHPPQEDPRAQSAAAQGAWRPRARPSRPSDGPPRLGHFTPTPGPRCRGRSARLLAPTLALVIALSAAPREARANELVWEDHWAEVGWGEASLIGGLVLTNAFILQLTPPK